MKSVLVVYLFVVVVTATEETTKAEETTNVVDTRVTTKPNDRIVALNALKTKKTFYGPLWLALDDNRHALHCEENDTNTVNDICRRYPTRYAPFGDCIYGYVLCSPVGHTFNYDDYI